MNELESPTEKGDWHVGHIQAGPTAVLPHERNALTVAVNGCLQTSHVESEGAHFTHAIR
jgi:hypothetical protein